MNLSSVPVANRCHIAFFGCTNAGKSSLINAFLSQDLSVVSDIKGTTTDPVKKTMELLPYGPIVAIDTAGFDDNTSLSEQRISKTLDVIKKTNIAILVVDAQKGLSEKDRELIKLFKDTPYIIAYNKSDLIENIPNTQCNEIYVSAKNNINIKELKELTGSYIAKFNNDNKLIVVDKLNPTKDTVVLVIPIDEAAPKGRLILPQQLVLRELLDYHIVTICTQVEELNKTLNNFKPNLVITDSQAFNEVKKIVPDDILLTSFSILFANYKGDLKTLIKGVRKIRTLNAGDNILISEGCTHHRQCNDIGSYKIPKWLKEITGKDFSYSYSSGCDFPNDLSKFDLVIHCGGCMLNEKEMKSRIHIALEQNIPIVNYGILISYINGILPRSLEIFPEFLEFIDEQTTNN